MVYIRSLNKNILPYYIKPADNELFSSWLCRISISHNVKPRTFLKNYLVKDPNLWNRDIDVSFNRTFVDFFARHTPLEKERIKEMFLTSYEGWAFSTVSSALYSENILRAGVKHRFRSLKGQMFCSSCLSVEGIYKKEWRLVTSIVCVECNELLQDSCRYCNHPITFFRCLIDNNRTSVGSNSITNCSNCLSDLRKQKSIRKPTSNEIQYQKYINRTISSGWNSESNYSFTYIYMLIRLSTLMYSDKKNNRFKEGVYLSKRNVVFPVVNKALSAMAVEKRREVLPFVNSILRNKEVLEKVLKRGKVTKSYVDPEYELPFWFQSKIL